MSECELFWVGGTLFWVGEGGEWGCMVHYFEWVEVDGALFWMGGGKWENSLVGWGGWDEWEWVHCLIIPFQNALLRIRMSF